MTYKLFNKEDEAEAYRNWLAANPLGYVVNTYREATREYLKMHKANCKNGIHAHQYRNPTTD